LVIVAGLVVVLVAVAALVVLRGRSARVDQRAAGPVLLVPGYGGGTADLDRLAARLAASGHRAEVVAPLDGGTGDLAAQASRLGALVSARLAAGAASVDVVGYSAGGVVARIWATQLGGAAHARRIVTLGSPHHGTDVAQLAAAVSGGACPRACQELVPGSDLLARLPDTAPGPLWTSIWSDADQVVTPPDSARLQGAVDVPVQAVCPDAATPHGALPTDPLVVALVIAALGPTPPRQPPGQDECARLRGAGG
jgi:hypothetical protein